MSTCYYTRFIRQPKVVVVKSRVLQAYNGCTKKYIKSCVLLRTHTRNCFDLDYRGLNWLFSKLKKKIILISYAHVGFINSCKLLFFI